MDEFEFLDPSGEAEIEKHPLAPRLETLQGTRLGIIENNKTNADKFLMLVFEEMREMYGVAEVKMIRKKELSQPALPDQLQEIAAYGDFAITGIGD